MVGRLGLNSPLNSPTDPPFLASTAALRCIDPEMHRPEDSLPSVRPLWHGDGTSQHLYNMQLTCIGRL